MAKQRHIGTTEACLTNIDHGESEHGQSLHWRDALVQKAPVPDAIGPQYGELGHSQ